MVEELTPAKAKEILEDFKNNYIDETNEIKTEYKNAFNIFNILNLREDSHTELLAWLLTVKEDDNGIINNIKINFRKDFFEQVFEIKDINKNEIKVEKQYNYNDEKTKNKNYIDILITCEPLKFVGVIENKLDADISLDTTNTTQLERYRNFVLTNEKYKDYQKRFIFLCPEESLLEKNKPSKYKEVIINEKIYKFNNADEIIKKLNNEQTDQNLIYKIIDYATIIKILYKLITQDKTNNKEIKEILDNITKDKPKSIKNFLDNIKNVENLKTQKDLKGNNYNKPKNYNLPLFDILSEKILEDDKILIILQQYIEYWENFAKFIDGYTNIVKDKTGELWFIYDVCAEIKKYESIYTKYKDIIDKIVK